MKSEKLLNILSLGEGQTIEFKSHCRAPRIIGQVVCSFLNTAGGYVVCGVDNKGIGVGIPDSEAAKKLLSAIFLKHLSPKALVSVEIHKLESKSVIVVEVPTGKDTPYGFEDVVFIREGEKTQKADINTIRDLVLRKQVEPERWERRISSADIAEDVDETEVGAASKAISKNQRSLLKDPGNTYRVLEDLSVAKFGRLTNGGDVFFGRDPGKRIPQVRVRAAFFSTDRASNTFHDMKSFDGPLLLVLEQVYDFIVRNTQTTATFKKKNLHRMDEPIYPEEAIREGLVNAFAHRDYADSSGGVIISIYPLRLEIWNSGSLPPGVTPESLIHGHISVLRNPDIAHILYLRSLMEKLGRGSVLILQSCKDKNLPQPKWVSDEKTGVTLTFFAPQYSGETAQNRSNNRSNRPTQSATQSATQSTDPVERLLLALQSGEQSPDNLRAKLSIKHRPTFRQNYIHPALEKGFIEMTVPDKPSSRLQKYRLTEKGQQGIGKHL